MDIETAKKRYPDAAFFQFGDSEALCDELIALVRSGKKTATCGALRDFQEDGEAMPVVGRQDIAVNWYGEPQLLIETVEVTQRRFCDVDADFALAEGENDSLAGWQRDHQAYFTRNSGFDPEMELICERFRLIEEFR